MTLLKRFSILVFAVFALSCSGEPQLSVDQAIYKTGELVPREKRVHWFKLTNNGDAELIVENVRPLCDCIEIDSVPKAIAPGATDSLKATYTAPDSAGPDNSYLMIRTNTKQKDTKLGFQAEVMPVKLTAADSSVVVFPFQVSGMPDGQKFSLDIFQYIVEHLPKRFPAKNPNEMTKHLGEDPAFEVEPLHDVARKWANILGIRFVVLGDVRPSATGKGLDISIMLVDGTFRLPVGKRIVGVPKEAAFASAADTLSSMLANLFSLEKQAFVADLQRKWGEQRKKMIGKPAPPLEAEEILTGKKIDVADFAGKPLIIQFFSSDCEHCEGEMDWLANLVREHPDIAALGVSVDIGEIDSVRNFIKGKELPYPIILPTKENEKQLDPYYGGATPQTVIISPEGIVAEYFMGFSTQTLGQFEKILIGMAEKKNNK